VLLTRAITGVLQLDNRHRASTSTRCHFAFGAMLSQQRNPCTDCKSAQQCTTRGNPYHCPKFHTGSCSSVGMRWGTDTHTHTHVTNIHFSSSTTHEKCNNYDAIVNNDPSTRVLRPHYPGTRPVLTGVQHVTGTVDRIPCSRPVNAGTVYRASSRGSMLKQNYFILNNFRVAWNNVWNEIKLF